MQTRAFWWFHFWRINYSVVRILPVRWVFVVKEQQVERATTSAGLLLRKEQTLTLTPSLRFPVFSSSLTSRRPDTCSCWCFSDACSKADKILRCASSHILQICCLGCGAAVTWSVWKASWEDGTGFQSSCFGAWRRLHSTCRCTYREYLPVSTSLRFHLNFEQMLFSWRHR